VRYDSSRWRFIIGLLLLATSLALIGAPAGPADAGTGCFNFNVDNSVRMGVDEIDEASGLVLSRQMPGVMWTHNDDDPGASNAENNRIYAVNETGDLLATVQFTLTSGLDIVPSPKFFELEDISFGPGPGRNNDNYLYLADTGDNSPPTREYASIYRFPEPVFTPDPDNPVTINVSESQLEGTRFNYESFLNSNETKPRNVEGVFADPASGDLFLFEKALHAIDTNGNLADGSAIPKVYAFVYRVKEGKLFPADTTKVRTAAIASYVQGDFGAGTFGISGADISADGTIIAVKNTQETFYWHRDPHESVVETFERDHTAPCNAPDGMKGEALAIGPISDRFVMIREGLISPIWQAVFTNQDYECLGEPATIIGTAGMDTISGTSGDDVIVTFGGNDSVVGRGGKDRICLGPGDDHADGGSGSDRIDGGWGWDELSGGTGKDILKGRRGRDVIAGNGGDDDVRGGKGKDRLFGGRGDDILTGGSGQDSIYGKSKNDVLKGGGGTDACDGGAGTDSAAKCEDVIGVP